MFNKKRWWFGFGLGVVFALTLFFSAFERETFREGYELLAFLFLLGFGIACSVSHYTWFGKGRCVYDYRGSDTTFSPDGHPITMVPPHPFLGGLATGYVVASFLELMGFVGEILYH